MTAWSTPATVRARLRKKWDGGSMLTERERGTVFAPVDLPIRGPTAGELGSRYAEVADWVRDWARNRGPGQVSTRLVGSRRTGANELPDRVRLDTFDDLVAFLGVSAQARRHHELAEWTRAAEPLLHPWVVDKPMRALAHEAEFDRLLGCVRWLVDNADRHRFLREIDVPGVDTKFVERHRGLIAELAGLVTHGPTDPHASDFAQRYGFRTKPSRVRVRILDPQTSPFAPGISDIELRVDELASLPLDVERVFLVENEVTCLAFPPVRQSLLIFGGGYAVSRVSGLAWLGGTALHYWGDIDTHGFRILDLLRARFPAVGSMLMDRATLLAHEAHWDHEPAQANVNLAHLTVDEAALYRDLVEDVFGPNVRLEQERVRYPLIEAAVAALG